MKSKANLLAASAFLAIAVTSSSLSAAPLSLGGLEWDSFGDVHLQGGVVTLTTAYGDGSDDATNLNLSGNDPLLAGGDLEGEFGLSSGALDADDLLNQASEGSGFSRMFSVSAGDKITFNWQLYTADDLNADYGFFVVGNSVFSLAGASDATLPGTGGYLTQTGVGSYEYVFSTAGNFTVGFGVADIGDATASTALAISNVNVTTVPEPSTYALIGIAVLGAAFSCRRKRKLAA
jgi:hypothetical protein